MKVVNKGQSVFKRLSLNAQRAFVQAHHVSKVLEEKNVSTKSLFLAILMNKNCLATRVVNDMGVDREALLKDLLGDTYSDAISPFKSVEVFKFSKDLEDVIQFAYDIARKRGHVYVGTEHLMLSLFLKKGKYLKKAFDYGLTVDGFFEALSRSAVYPVGLLSKSGGGVMDLEDSSFLDFLGEDLVKLAKQGNLDPVIDREDEIDNLIKVLSRRKKNNPLVVGQAGVGKTVLIEGLAQKIADGCVPPSLQGKRIVSLNISEIMSGSRMRGDVEEKVNSIINEVVSSEDIILFIDEIHNIVTSGIPGSSSDIGTLLKPALLQEDFSCIGAITTEEYTRYFERDNALARRFQPIFLKESSTEESTRILEHMKPILEEHHMIRISDEAVSTAVSLSDRYIADRYLPDKAIDLLDEAAAQKRLGVEAGFKDMSELLRELESLRVAKELKIESVKMEDALKLQQEEDALIQKIEKREKQYKSYRKRKGNEVGVEDVRLAVSKWTGIPLNTLGKGERKALLDLEKNLNRFVVGQGEATQAVASAIKRARTGIVDVDRPWASFLFLGPTGVGKTELAKVLTRELFGDSDRLIQVDMSEMMEMHSVSKLIGSPPGYVGYQKGGWLTEKVRREPHSVLLFDEVEKAHPDVLNLLLQILEYGHLTDGRGRRVNFKNTVVILTSNIGAEEIRKDKVLGFSQGGTKGRADKEIDKAYSSMRNVLLGELRNTLRPELLNRLDDVVIFRSLTRKDAKKILRLLVEDLNGRLEEEGFKIHLKAKAVNYIVKKSFSEEYGARPLRRSLQSHVENVLADYILEEEVGEGDVLKIGVEDEKIVILDE